MTKSEPDRFTLGSVAVSSVHISMDEMVNSGCREIYDYWDAVRGARFAPTWRSFDLIRLPGNLIRYTHVVDISAEPFDVKFRFWGTGLTDVLYFDRTGQSLLTTNMGYLDEHRREQVLADYKAVIESQSPMPFLWDASATRVNARRLIVPSIRLPLSDDNENVTGVITHFDLSRSKAMTGKPCLMCITGAGK